jgi:hypothetical protein
MRTASPRASVARASSSSARSRVESWSRTLRVSQKHERPRKTAGERVAGGETTCGRVCSAARRRSTLTPLRPLRDYSRSPKVPTHYLYLSLSYTHGICCKGVRVARNALLEGVSSLQAPCKALQHSRKVSAPRRGACARRPIAGSTASRGAA